MGTKHSGGSIGASESYPSNARVLLAFGGLNRTGDGAAELRHTGRYGESKPRCNSHRGNTTQPHTRTGESPPLPPSASRREGTPRKESHGAGTTRHAGM